MPGTQPLSGSPYMHHFRAVDKIFRLGVLDLKGQQSLNTCMGVV